MPVARAILPLKAEMPSALRQENDKPLFNPMMNASREFGSPTPCLPFFALLLSRQGFSALR
jgi:hypothetical protein